MIRTRHAAGELQAELARQFGISYQRVHQMCVGQENRLFESALTTLQDCIPNLLPWMREGMLRTPLMLIGR